MYFFRISMKRRREESESGVTTTTLFEMVPHEVFHHIASFLRLVDVCALYRAVVRLPDGGVPMLAGQPLCTQLDNFGEPVRHQCTSEVSRQIAQAYRHVTENAYGYRRGVSGEKTEALLLATRRLLNDPCLYSRCLYERVVCDCCRDAFATVSLWKETTHPVFMCVGCDRSLRSTALRDGAQAPLTDWSWVTTQRMKQLCGVPVSVKADAFAAQHCIRSIASTDHMSTSAKKNCYLYMDIKAFISSK